jgi:replicative DNA helicase
MECFNPQWIGLQKLRIKFALLQNNNYSIYKMATLKLGTRAPKKSDAINMAMGKLPPQAIEIENAILGAIMVESSKITEVLDIIQSPECFYNDANQRIYAAIRALFEKGSPIDFITVSEELKRTSELELVGGNYYITSLTRDVHSSAHVEEHARIVMQKFIMRELIRISNNVIGDAYEDGSDVFDLLDKAETGLYEITDKHLRRNFKTISSIVIEAIKEIQEQAENKEDLTGIPSGFTDLDRLTGGWQKTDLIILAARPAVGKTAFALNLVMNAAYNSNKPTAVAFFSLEMSAGQLVKRMLSATTDVPLEKISKGNLQDYEIIQIQQRMNKLAESTIFIDDQAALNIFELRAKCRRLKQRNDLGLVIIDYLQLMTASIDKSGNREQEISKISRELKALAKELEIPIIALSQLNRSVETRGGSKVPQLSDLRESGAIEQDADMVMFLYRPEYHNTPGAPANDKKDPAEVATIPGETWINVAKHRNGQTDVIKVIAELAYQRFNDMPDFNTKYGGDNAPTHSSGESVNPRAGFTNDYGERDFATMKSKSDDFTSNEDSINPDNDDIPF